MRIHGFVKKEKKKKKGRLLLNLQWFDLVLYLLNAVFGGHQLGLFGSNRISDLLGFLFVLLQVAQLHLTLFDCLSLFEPQLTHRLQGFDIPGTETDLRRFSWSDKV